LVWEIFIERVYDIKCHVEKQYDLGGNIGLSALFFISECKADVVISFEPNSCNYNILSKNAHQLGGKIQIRNVAVTDSNGYADFYYSRQSHALPSLYTQQEFKEVVETTSLTAIIDSKNYGLKIDIEGGESCFSESYNEIVNAQFIVGELHFSDNSGRNNKVNSYFNIIKDNFDVSIGRPNIYFVGNKVELCYSYKAVRKKPLK
jgi:FkbM family methyltransferase